MHPRLKEAHDILVMTNGLRDQLLTLLSDEDLEFTLAGNPTLGTILRDFSDTQQSYITSFETFEQDFSEHSLDPDLTRSVAKLQARFAQLDNELRVALEALSEEDFQTKRVNRGDLFELSLGAQLHTFREALLIECAKISVYLRAMNKTLPEQWRAWIG